MDIVGQYVEALGHKFIVTAIIQHGRVGVDELSCVECGGTFYVETLDGEPAP